MEEGCGTARASLLIGSKYSGKRCSLNVIAAVKKDLSNMDKRISQLHRKRKNIYGNSVKIKQRIHCQINQLVRCLHERERYLLSQVDEAHITNDSTLSESLLDMISTQTSCQTLYHNLEHFIEGSDVLTKINHTLGEITAKETLSIKPLQFISDFENMKLKLSSFGAIIGDGIKNDSSCLAEKIKDVSDMFSRCCKNEELCHLPIATAVHSEKHFPVKSPDLFLNEEHTSSADSFEVIDVDEESDFEENKDTLEFVDNSNVDPLLEQKVPNFSLERKQMTQWLNNLNEKQYQRETCEPSYLLKKQLESIMDAREMGVGKENTLKHNGKIAKSLSDCVNSSIKQNSKYDNENDKNISPVEAITNAFSSYLMTKNTESWLCSK